MRLWQLRLEPAMTAVILCRYQHLLRWYTAMPNLDINTSALSACTLDGRKSRL